MNETCKYTPMGYSISGTLYETSCEQEADGDEVEEWTFCPSCGKEIELLGNGAGI